jgi:hypothetical protein
MALGDWWTRLSHEFDHFTVLTLSETKVNEYKESLKPMSSFPATTSYISPPDTLPHRVSPFFLHGSCLRIISNYALNPVAAEIMPVIPWSSITSLPQMGGPKIRMDERCNSEDHSSVDYELKLSFAASMYFQFCPVITLRTSLSCMVRGSGRRDAGRWDGEERTWRC